MQLDNLEIQSTSTQSSSTSRNSTPNRRRTKSVFSGPRLAQLDLERARSNDLNTLLTKIDDAKLAELTAHYIPEGYLKFFIIILSVNAKIFLDFRSLFRVGTHEQRNEKNGKPYVYVYCIGHIGGRIRGKIPHGDRKHGLCYSANIRYNDGYILIILEIVRFFLIGNFPFHKLIFAFQIVVPGI